MMFIVAVILALVFLTWTSAAVGDGVSRRLSKSRYCRGRRKWSVMEAMCIVFRFRGAGLPRPAVAVPAAAAVLPMAANLLRRLIE